MPLRKSDVPAIVTCFMTYYYYYYYPIHLTGRKRCTACEQKALHCTGHGIVSLASSKDCDSRNARGMSSVSVLAVNVRMTCEHDLNLKFKWAGHYNWMGHTTQAVWYSSRSSLNAISIRTRCV